VLERTIQELGPDNVSAFIAEPIVGAAAPALAPPPGYYERIREICDRYGVLWIADEIVTGFGRTGLGHDQNVRLGVPVLVAHIAMFGRGYRD